MSVSKSEQINAKKGPSCCGRTEMNGSPHSVHGLVAGPSSPQQQTAEEEGENEEATREEDDKAERRSADLREGQ